MKRISLFLTGTLVAFSSLAQGETSEVETSNTAVTPNDPVANTKSQTTGTGDRDEAKPGYVLYSNRLKEIDDKLAKLKAKPNMAKTYGQSQKKRLSLKQEIDAMKDAPADRWAKSKDSLDKRFRELEGELEKVLN